MKTSERHALMHAVLDGEATPEEARELERHLSRKTLEVETLRGKARPWLRRRRVDRAGQLSFRPRQEVGNSGSVPFPDRVELSCCRFRGHEDKIVTKELESGYDETEVQP